EVSDRNFSAYCGTHRYDGALHRGRHDVTRSPRSVPTVCTRSAAWRTSTFGFRLNRGHTRQRVREWYLNAFPVDCNRHYATFLLIVCIHGGLGHLRLQIINEVGFDPTSMHGKWTIGRQFLAWLIKFWCKVGVLYHTAVERQDGRESGNTHLCQRAM